MRIPKNFTRYPFTAEFCEVEDSTDPSWDRDSYLIQKTEVWKIHWNTYKEEVMEVFDYSQIAVWTGETDTELI